MPTARWDVAALEARRFQAARLFARGQSQATVARMLGVSRVAAHRWYHAWHEQGRGALKSAGRVGRKPRLDRRQLARVDTALRQGPGAHGFATELWTLPRIATVIERLTGVHYHPAHSWRLLRGLGWSLQRPGRQARERNEPTIPAERQGRGDRQPPLPVRAGMDQDRSLSARRPRAADDGLLREPAFVLENDPGPASPGVFFSLGHRRVFHCWMAGARGSTSTRNPGRTPTLPLSPFSERSSGTSVSSRSC